MPPIEGRIEGIGRFILPDSKEDLTAIKGEPIDIGKGWTAAVCGANGSRVPLSEISIRAPKEQARKHPVRFRNQREVTINVRNGHRRTLILRRIT